MNKLMIAFVVAAVSGLASVANGAPAATNVVRKMTPELAAKLREGSYRAFGGQVRKPGTAKGAVAFVNAQKRVPASVVKEAVAKVDEKVHVICKYAEVESVNAANPRDAFTKLDCKLGVAVVDDPKLPTMLIAPEDGFGVVNIAALAADEPDAAKLASRVRKEVMRAFALAGGCSFMCRGPIVMRETARPVELDDIPYEEYGIDALNQLSKFLPTVGVTPWHQTNYRKACREGWAHSPTNDVERKIWNNVHKLPTNPIKIEFDPKRDAGK